MLWPTHIRDALVVGKYIGICVVSYIRDSTCRYVDRYNIDGWIDG